MEMARNSYLGLSNFFLSFFLFFLLVWIFIGSGACGATVEVDLLSGGVLNISFPIYFDRYGSSFSLVVLLISGCVMLYSKFYMSGCKSYGYYSLLVKSFVLFMMVFISVPNVLGMMVGWDGLGLVSFLLVVFYQDKYSLSSGLLTFFSNRVGDVMLMIVVCLLSAVSIWDASDFMVRDYLKVVLVLLFFASMTKSAQVPFSAWLPAAMAAPTPISALVHSSTLVTAGCFLLVRFGGSLDSSFHITLSMVCAVGGLMAGMSSLFEWDLKKVVALSTMGQMSVIIMAVGVGAADVGYFHLLCHALYKSLLFMCAGVMIHCAKAQDIRHLGKFTFKSPVLVAMTHISLLSLVGFPFMTGFYSKDLVLEFIMISNCNMVVVGFVFVSVALSAICSCRVLMIFHSPSMGLPLEESAGVSSDVLLPCFILMVGSVVGGVMIQYSFFGFGSACSWSVFIKLSALITLFVGVVLVVLIIKTSVSRLSSWKDVIPMFVELWGEYWYLREISGALSAILGWGLVELISLTVEFGWLEFLISGSGLGKITNGLVKMYKSGYSDKSGLKLACGILVLSFFTMNSISSGSFFGLRYVLG
uniref:NADH-ubiquinone oxidoreductase chain 5 n=1 Tax=Macoma balthica TaxID=1903275 RepID=A0A6B7FTX6_MACBL|nr:NADH dehydrogenase subunit 5 [Macoma balthica]